MVPKIPILKPLALVGVVVAVVVALKVEVVAE